MRSQAGAWTAALVAGLVGACSHQAAVESGMPAPNGATVPAITAADLKERLSIFADDSMLGRRGGSIGNMKGTAYIEAEVRRFGLEPAGESGGYFQSVPLVNRTLAQTSGITVEGTSFAPFSDFLAMGAGNVRPFAGTQAVYAGSLADPEITVPAEQLAGKFLVLSTPSVSLFRLPRGAQARFAEAAAVAIVLPGAPPENLIAQVRAGSVGLHSGGGPGLPATLLITPRVASALFGADVQTLKPGTAGKTVQGAVMYAETPAPSRNVVAILRGSDPKLRGEYVAIGAHNDHIGIRHPAVDKDSLRAYNTALYALRYSIPAGQAATREQIAAIHVNMDSVRRLYPVARMDSINNGADDDGSGSVSVLEIAEAFAKSTGAKPKRSILFVWHTGEELGLLGSRYYTDNPTVPRDSIVAQLNMDMVGRGGAEDLPGGGPNYLQLVGSRRLSTELGDLVEAVNSARAQPFKFDYSFDANGHPENIYCRSDHYMYARYGIPVTFFTTGLHRDYHQVTDEVQFIDFDHMARVDQFVFDIAGRVANLDHRLVVDKPKPDPTAPCRQ